MKRFQECNWLVKFWRYRHYTYIPFKWLYYKYFKPFYTIEYLTLEKERIKTISLKEIIFNIKLFFTKKEKRKFRFIKCQLWSILIGTAQCDMKWYHTMDEVKELFK